MNVEEDKRRLRAVELATREEANEFDEFEVSVEPLIPDSRDFIDNIFYDFIPGIGKVRKKIYYAVCEGPDIPEVPAGYICVLLNYKLKKSQGKKDPLGGNHVLVISTLKGQRIVPLHQVRKYAVNLYRAMDAIEDELTARDIPLIPDIPDE